jgi:hypothetical protein
VLDDEATADFSEKDASVHQIELFFFGDVEGRITLFTLSELDANNFNLSCCHK